LPKLWKESIIVPIYKTGDRTDCNNYWHISVLSGTYKLISNIFLSMLTPHAEKITGTHQYEFQRNRSATDHIYCFRQILQKNGNKMRLCICNSYALRKPMIQLVSREVLCNIPLSLASHKTSKANKSVSKSNLQHRLCRQAFVWLVFYWEQFEKRRCCIAIAFKFCSRICDF
jgi:hypothetical protein